MKNYKGNPEVTVTPNGNYEGMSTFAKWYHLNRRNGFYDGGSFMQSLKECFFNADSGNRAKLITGFPDLFNELDITLTTKKV